MKNLYYLKNTVQEYEWGSKDLMPDLLGIDNNGRPKAEMWLGSHHRAPSSVETEGALIGLDKFIAENKSVTGNGGELPFLMKLLAVEKPLSVQVHPNKQKAEEGFDRENAENIPLNSPERSYKDTNQKTEMLCAVTPFTALCGFRRPGDIYSLLNITVPVILRNEIEQLKKGDIKNLLKRLLTMDKKDTKLLFNEFTASASSRIGTTNEAYPLCFELMDMYPGDTAALMPMLLNLIKLDPGTAICIMPGQPHAYISGIGVELMTSSDNVLRAGLTGKHKDISEFLAVTAYASVETKYVEPVEGKSFKKYDMSSNDFALSDISPNEVFSSSHKGLAAVMLCIAGDGKISFANGETFDISRGQSALIPAYAPDYTISGKCRIFAAAEA